MTTTKPPVLTDEEIYALIQPHPKEIGIVGVARAIEQAVLERAGADAVPVADCWSDNEGDSWRDSPDDCDFLGGLKVGDEYELQASIRSWPERFRVAKVPDDVSDDYAVEPVAIRALKGTPAAAVADAPQLNCKMCGVDRFKEDCKGNRMQCGMTGTDQAAQLSGNAGEVDAEDVPPLTKYSDLLNARDEAKERIDEMVRNQMTNFGLLVRAMRITVGTTLYAMSKELGVSSATLSGMETGRHPVGPETVREVAAFFRGRGLPDVTELLAIAASKGAKP